MQPAETKLPPEHLPRDLSEVGQEHPLQTEEALWTEDQRGEDELDCCQIDHAEEESAPDKTYVFAFSLG